MARNLLSVLSLCAAAFSVNAAAHAETLTNIFSEQNGARLTGEMTVEAPGVYRFEVLDGRMANVAVDGATVIDGMDGETTGAVALSSGSVSITIEAMDNAPAPPLGMTTPGSDTVFVVMGDDDEMSGASPSQPLRVGSGAGESAAMKSASDMTAQVETARRPRAEAGAPARDLRSRLRDRVRDRVIENAVREGRIARATINGATSNYQRVGETLTVEATPPPGMEFVRWAGDVFALNDPTASSTTLTISQGGANVFAIYAPVGSQNPEQSTPPANQPPGNSPPTAPPPGEAPAPNDPPAGTIVVTVNGGVGDGSYAAGANVVVRANDPSVGETFAAWTGDIAALSDPTSPVAILTVPETAVSITATYAASAMSASLFSSTFVASPRGATVSGVVQAPEEMSVTYDVFDDRGRMTASGLTASVNPDTGAFAARIFEDSLPENGDATVVMRGVSANGGAASTVVNFRVANSTDDIDQLLSRITFGPSQAMSARARQIGFDAFLEEQLNPLSIDDTAFRQLNPDDLFDYTENHNSRHLRRLALAYALYTERQLQEVLAAFWENHFYTSPLKGNTVFYETVEKAGFREHALGRFRDLLEVSMKSASMMYYLDNEQSSSGSINENYARELLELHTVGVNSTYTEEDIIEVARVLTGWRAQVTNPDRPDGHRGIHEFFFQWQRHDRGDKTISFLNTTIEGIEGEEGIQEGEELLELLAAHPDTAAFICRKLVTLFVSDAPLPGLNDRCAAEFLATDGDIQDVVRVILTSAEFRSTPTTFHSKYKTPFEYVTSLVRAFDLEPRVGEFQGSMLNMADEVDDAGYDLYDFQAPTGLPEVGGAWVGAASVLERVKFAVRALRAATANLQIDRRAILDAAPADTAEGVAAIICVRAMLNRCTRQEFEEMVDAVYGDDEIFDPSGNVDSAVSRALQVAAASQSFALQ